MSETAKSRSGFRRTDEHIDKSRAWQIKDRSWKWKETRVVYGNKLQRSLAATESIDCINIECVPNESHIAHNWSTKRLKGREVESISRKYRLKDQRSKRSINEDNNRSTTDTRAPSMQHLHQIPNAQFYRLGQYSMNPSTWNGWPSQFLERTIDGIGKGCIRYINNVKFIGFKNGGGVGINCSGNNNKLHETELFLLLDLLLDHLHTAILKRGKFRILISGEAPKRQDGNIFGCTISLMDWDQSSDLGVAMSSAWSRLLRKYEFLVKPNTDEIETGPKWEHNWPYFRNI